MLNKRPSGAAMSQKHTENDQHEAAALHHERAARFHREAARHFDSGKDYEHAAHQAMMAYGHALHGIDHANEAARLDAQGTSMKPEAAGIIANIASAAEHHAAAAELHEQAARHLLQAARHFGEDKRHFAARETQLAAALGLRALSHGDAAARQQVTHWTDAAPTASLIRRDDPRAHPG
jgi:hypothetical protein